MAKDSKQQILKGALAIVAWCLAIIFLRNLVVVKHEVTTGEIDIVSSEIQQATTKYDEYLNFAKTAKVLPVIENLKSPSFIAKDVESNNQIAKEFLVKNSKGFLTTDKIENGFLKVIAKIDGQKFTTNESIYIYLDDGKLLGGHLFRPNSIVLNSEQDKLELVFNLKEIPFIEIPYDESKTPKLANWLTQINKTEKHFIGSFISTTRAGAYIESVSIIYSGSGSFK